MNKSETVKNILLEIFKFIGINPSFTVDETAEGVLVKITGNDLNFLIGFRGESLYALQSVVAMILNRRTGEWTNIDLDINDYKSQKDERIERITKSFIDRVRFLGQEVEMPPMNPSERRKVHVFVSNYDDVVSESVGDGPERRVTLKPKS